MMILVSMLLQAEKKLIRAVLTEADTAKKFANETAEMLKNASAQVDLIITNLGEYSQCAFVLRNIFS